MLSGMSSSLSTFICVFSYTDFSQLVEIYMPQEDAPAALKSTAAAAAKTNEKE
jgi:TPP-dependent 2-oxoacid decarboxylase